MLYTKMENLGKKQNNFILIYIFNFIYIFILIYLNLVFLTKLFVLLFINGDWGLGIGDW